MNALPDAPLEAQIAQWRAYVCRGTDPDQPAVSKLEQRLREQVASLIAAGLAADEAFLVALKRIARLDAPSREFLHSHAARLWMEPPEPGQEPAKNQRAELLVVLALAALAAAAVKAPELFGVRLDGREGFYLRNASLFTFPLLVLYFVWKRGSNLKSGLWLVLSFVAAAVFANVFPFREGADTEALTALHLPIALWLAVGLAYVGGQWFANGGRMHFVRFSGELLIYYVLIALGGGVLCALALAMFNSIGMKVEWLVGRWVVPCGAAGALIIASWLAEARQTRIGNIAPMLTKLFTPLFTLLLLVFLATMVWTGRSLNVERELLIAFDLLLAVVVGLVLYATSAREPHAPPGFFDGLQLLLVASALLIDALALGAIATRISGFGFTPNRVAALGENLILLGNLAGTAWLYARFMLRKSPFATLERWQIACLPTYAAWAAVVVTAFPPLFGYR